MHSYTSLFDDFFKASLSNVNANEFSVSANTSSKQFNSISVHLREFLGCAAFFPIFSLTLVFVAPLHYAYLLRNTTQIGNQTRIIVYKLHISHRRRHLIATKFDS